MIRKLVKIFIAIGLATTIIAILHVAALASSKNQAIPFDEVSYSKEVDQWMKENAPKSSGSIDLGLFVAKLKNKIKDDGQKYGDQDLISKQYGAYLLYDIAFVGNSVFSNLLPDSNNQFSLKNIPAPANGNYPDTVTQTALIQDKESNKLINSTSYYVDNHSDRTVVMHGGFRNSWTNGIDNIQTRLFYDRGYNLLIVDNRTTGKSEGNFITFGYYESDDVAYWINQEVSNKPNQKILLDGGSMGASTILSTLTKNLPKNVKGAVEDCGFSSINGQLSYAYDTFIDAASTNAFTNFLLDSLNLKKEYKEENINRINRIYGKYYLNLDFNSF